LKEQIRNLTLRRAPVKLREMIAVIVKART
jgi:hypothetical protein